MDLDGQKKRVGFGHQWLTKVEGLNEGVRVEASPGVVNEVVDEVDSDRKVGRLKCRSERGANRKVGSLKCRSEGGANRKVGSLSCRSEVGGAGAWNGQLRARGLCV